jgi:hypothetical protein
MTKPTFPALAALLIIWTLGAIAITAIYVIHRSFTGQPAPAAVVNASTLAPIFGEPAVAIEPPKARKSRKPKRTTLATMLEAEALV